MQFVRFHTAPPRAIQGFKQPHPICAAPPLKTSKQPLMFQIGGVQLKWGNREPSDVLRLKRYCCVRVIVPPMTLYNRPRTRLSSDPQVFQQSRAEWLTEWWPPRSMTVFDIYTAVNKWWQAAPSPTCADSRWKLVNVAADLIQRPQNIMFHRHVFTHRRGGGHFPIVLCCLSFFLRIFNVMKWISDSSVLKKRDQWHSQPKGEIIPLILTNSDVLIPKRFPSLDYPRSDKYYLA